MLIGQKHTLLRALPDSWLWPSVSFSTQCPQAIRHQNSSRGRKNMMGNPSALSNASQTSGCQKGRQQPSRNTEYTEITVNTITILMWRSIIFWMYYGYSLPLSPLDNANWIQVCEKIYTWATALKKKQMVSGPQKCCVQYRIALFGNTLP